MLKSVDILNIKCHDIIAHGYDWYKYRCILYVSLALSNNMTTKNDTHK